MLKLKRTQPQVSSIPQRLTSMLPLLLSGMLLPWCSRTSTSSRPTGMISAQEPPMKAVSSIFKELAGPRSLLSTRASTRSRSYGQLSCSSASLSQACIPRSSRFPSVASRAKEFSCSLEPFSVLLCATVIKELHAEPTKLQSWIRLMVRSHSPTMLPLSRLSWSCSLSSSVHSTSAPYSEATSAH